MNRTVLVVVVLAVLAAAGAVLVLSGGEPGEAGGDASGRAAPSAEGLPSFQGDAPEPGDAPRALVAEGAAGAAAGADSPAAAAAPTGPVRVVTGHVVRASDATPIEDLSVRWIEPESKRDGSTDATTDAEGRFRLASVPTHATGLVLSRAGTHAAPATHGFAPGADDLLDVELVFDSGFRIAGAVLDSYGAPIAGARVRATDVEVVSDEQGAFLLADVVAVDEAVVEVEGRAPRRTRETVEVLEPRSRTDVPRVELRLRGAGAIAGRVTHGRNEPAPGATVAVTMRLETSAHSEGVEGLSAECGEDGSYEVDHVPAGRYVVEVKQAGATLPLEFQVLTAAATTTAGGTRLALAPGVWIKDVVVLEGQATPLDVLLPAGAKLAGRVLDRAGAPVVRASVQLSRRMHWPLTGMDGHSISTSDDTMIESKPRADGMGEGTLQRKEGTVVTDERGHYEFSGLGPGERLLAVHDDGHRLSPATRTLELRGDEQLESVDFVLVAGLTLRGRVVDPAGRPLAGATIYITEPDSSSITQRDETGRSGDDGFFEAAGLTPGKKRISIWMEGYSYFMQEVEPDAPVADYTLTPSLKLRGEVVDASTGQPIEAFSLKVAKGNGWMETDVQAHAGGVFEHDADDDERCAVTVGAPGYDTVTLDDVLPSLTAVTPLRIRLVKQD